MCTAGYLVNISDLINFFVRCDHSNLLFSLKFSLHGKAQHSSNSFHISGSLSINIMPRQWAQQSLDFPSLYFSRTINLQAPCQVVWFALTVSMTYYPSSILKDDRLFWNTWVIDNNSHLIGMSCKPWLKAWYISFK